MGDDHSGWILLPLAGMAVGLTGAIVTGLGLALGRGRSQLVGTVVVAGLLLLVGGNLARATSLASFAVPMSVLGFALVVLSGIGVGLLGVTARDDAKP